MIDKKAKKKLIWRWLIWLAVLAFVFWYVKGASHYPRHITLEAKPDFWGVTYSPKLATELGLDWKETYLAILTDLKVKNIRLPIYWEEIEKSPGEYDFSTYDYIFDQGKKYNVHFIANIGYRLPRWPECHAPDWARQASDSQRQQDILAMLAMVVKRYSDRPELVTWQVENEPLFDWFGECPNGDKAFLEKEVALVRQLDSSRPILISASGELSTWQQEAKIGNLLGTTVYRVVWNKYFGYFRYPWPAWFYQVKARLVGLPKDKLMISELQAEPWIPKGNLADFPMAEAKKSMSIEQLRANLQYAIDTDLSQAYLWGVEWWYVQYQHGNTVYWTLMKDVIAKNQIN